MQVKERHHVEGPGSALTTRPLSSIDDTSVQMQMLEVQTANSRLQPRGKNRAWFGRGRVLLRPICHGLVILDMGALQNAWAVVAVALRTCSNRRCRCPHRPMLVSRGSTLASQGQSG